MKKTFYRPFIITTDFTVEPDFFDVYLDKGEWIDANILYKDYVSTATGGKPMKLFFVQEIKEFDIPLLRLINSIFKDFDIKPKEFRCDFFKVLPSGELPMHIDQKAKISFCLPIGKNTGYTVFEEGDVTLKIKYQSLIALNNLISHGVTSPKEERLLFRIGVHDTFFEEL